MGGGCTADQKYTQECENNQAQFGCDGMFVSVVLLYCIGHKLLLCGLVIV